MTAESEGPPVTLESLTWGWGDAYAIGYRQDQWTATRRDGHATITTQTMAGLETAITVDYHARPVPRAFDPPDPDSVTGQDSDSHHAPADDTEAVFLQAAMQAAFPAWTIEYSTHARAWIAHTRKKTICENSPVLLCAALLLIERRARQASSSPAPGDGRLP
jgi:hypothetical protein